MTTHKSFDFEPKTLKTGQASSAFRVLFDELGANSEAATLILQSTHPDGSSTTDSVPFDQLGTFSDLTVSGTNAHLTFRSGEGRHLEVILLGGPPSFGAQLRVSADRAEDAERAMNIVVRELGLEPAARVDVKLKEIEALSHRLDTLERVPSRARRSLRCFLSYRLEDAPSDRAATEVERFLSLLEVEVVTGRGYEPRSIRDKVDERLDGLDLAVLLVSSNGESFWTRDEITTARARGVYVIPIVGEGHDFFPGLFGDHEYIRYATDHVGDAFLKLLEGVLYVRRIRES